MNIMTETTKNLLTVAQQKYFKNLGGIPKMCYVTSIVYTYRHGKNELAMNEGCKTYLDNLNSCEDFFKDYLKHEVLLKFYPSKRIEHPYSVNAYVNIRYMIKPDSLHCVLEKILALAEQLYCFLKQDKNEKYRDRALFKDTVKVVEKGHAPDIRLYIPTIWTAFIEEQLKKEAQKR